MDKIRIVGEKRLSGQVEVSGAKNAALPILISSLLSEKECRFDRVPDLQDIRTTLKVLRHLGVSSKVVGSTVTLNGQSIASTEAPYDLVRTMRASVWVLGPLLARMGHAKVSLPGGCAIGARPINFHLEGLKKLGAQIELENGYVVAKANRLQGARVAFEFPSVGATANLMMAATLAKGETVLEGCAKEPEMTDLGNALKAMGAQIEGHGSDVIRIQGKDSLSGCHHPIMGDRIEAGTYLASAVLTQGDVKVLGISPDALEAVLVQFEQIGAVVERDLKGLSIRLQMKQRPQATNLTTLPFPGFPTDMQAQMMAVLCLASGTSTVRETIFENRFMHVPELLRLGADIQVKGNTAVIRGVESFTGAPLMATDLRASASLILGGLAAKGETIVNRVYHLDRGYEKLETKFKALGAEIERIA